MSDATKGQISHNAAEVYEEFFVPALFQPWTEQVAEAAGVQPDQRVLDVACGTGALARAIASQIGSNGVVVGLDINEGMLAVARRKAPQIDWRHGVAEDLPFEGDRFDAVVSQFGLMFFDDKVTAIKEMVRVLKPGGMLAIAVWDSLQNTPGYAAMVDLLQRLFGQDAADGLRMPYTLGEIPALRALLDRAGIPDGTITTHQGMAHFPSLHSWIHTDIKGWVLADLIDDAQFERLLTEGERVLQPFVTNGGAVSFPAPAHIVQFGKPVNLAS